MPTINEDSNFGAIRPDVEFNYAVCPNNAVAWMQRNGIRGVRSVSFPDYTAFHPGYILHYFGGTNKRQGSMSKAPAIFSMLLSATFHTQRSTAEM